MYKKILAFVCAVVVFGFLFYSIAIRSVVFADSGGGGSHRGDYIELQRADIDTEKTQSEISNTFLSDLWNNPIDNLDDLFCYAVGSIGAIFSDDTTLKSVKNQWNAIYANALEDPEVMRSIFYYGTDGQLYFTDEFIANTRDIVDQVTFNQGIVSIPCTQSQRFFDYGYGVGCLAISNALTLCLTGDDIRVMQYCPGGNFFNIGFSILDKYTVAPFSSYSVYAGYCSSLDSENLRYPSNGVTCQFFDSDLSLISFSSIDSYYCIPNSSGIFVTTSTGAISGSSFSICGSPNYWGSGVVNAAFVGSGSFEAYRTVDWLEFYLNGGTGVLRGNTYYKLDNAINTDEMENGSVLYSQLQEQYRNLAGEVADGNKTLSEINEILSDSILSAVDDIEQNTAVQVNYLKKILDELRDISKKLTYSNVVNTIDTIADALGAVGTWVNGLFDDGLDDISNILSDDLVNSFETSFPFSLPYDVALVVNLMAHEPVQPEINFQIKLPSFGIDYTYEFDQMDKFETIAKLTRFFSTIFFIMWMLNLTHKYTRKD